MENESFSVTMFNELRDIREKLGAVAALGVEIRSNKDLLGTLSTDVKELRQVLTNEVREVRKSFEDKLILLDARVGSLEKEKPVTDLVKKWVIGAIGVVVAAVLVALVAIVVPGMNEHNKAGPAERPFAVPPTLAPFAPAR